MAGEQPLDRIAALAAALAPIGAKQRGMPIEADDWNVLVATLRGILELDRGQFDALRGALADAYAPSVHEHLGTVSVAWLASDLQARIGDGASAVSLLGIISDLRKQVDASRQEVARLTAAFEDLQRRIDHSSVVELDRANVLAGFKDRLSGVEDLKTTVGAMTGTVQALRPGIEQVLQLRASLTDPAGNPIDVAGLQSDLQSLQGMRDLLTGVNGEVVHIKDIETTIAGLKDELDHATPGGLAQQFGTLSADLQGRVDAAIADQGAKLRDSVDQQLQASRDADTQMVREALDAANARTDATFEARVSDAQAQLNATLDARDQQLSANIHAEVLQASQAQVDAGLASIPAIVDQRMTVTENKLGTVIDQRLNDRFGGGHIFQPNPAGPATPPRSRRRASTASGAAAPSKVAAKAPGPAKPKQGSDAASATSSAATPSAASSSGAAKPSAPTKPKPKAASRAASAPAAKPSSPTRRRRQNSPGGR